MGTVHQLRWYLSRRRRGAGHQVTVAHGRRTKAPVFAFAFLSIALTVAGISLLPQIVAAPGAPARSASGVFAHVVDGDTLQIHRDKIRLAGIDAPELSQTCRDAQSREWACGQVAKARLAELVSRGGVSCAAQGRDIYGRTLAVCATANVRDLGEALVREGYAVNSARDFGDYAAAEIQARFSRRGLWQGDFERPRDWRRRHSQQELSN